MIPSPLNHQPVMHDEVIQALSIKSDGCYVDATFGRGGHAKSILETLSQKGQLWVFDRDPEAIAVAQSWARKDARIHVVHQSYTHLDTSLSYAGLMNKVDGIIADLGVSSPQFDNAERGFSFQHDGPLDMRFNPDEGKSAAQWLQRAKLQEITDVIREYGEENHAMLIGKAIVKAKEKSPILTTSQLANIIAQAHPRPQRKIHPATKSFMGIRLFINKELEQLLDFLPQCETVLKPGGRMVILSFHSLEDRLVKRFIQGPGYDPKHMFFKPVYGSHMKKIPAAKLPSELEKHHNPRARSAVLRAAEKVEK